MSSTRNTILLLATFLLFMFGWNWMLQKIWPVKPKTPQPNQEAALLVMGGMANGAEPVHSLTRVGKIEDEVPLEPEAKKEPLKEPMAKAKDQPEIKADVNRKIGELIPLGHSDNPYYLQVLLNTRGGSVQQVVLTEFPEGSREGLEVMENGKPRPLHLVPGVRRPRADTIRGQRNVPFAELKPGPYDITNADDMTEPSFMMYHYEKPGDERPAWTLGMTTWKVVEKSNDADADEQRVVFQTELGEPHNLVITKTFTLKRKEYHLGLQVDIKRKDGTKGPNQFRYQLTGANNLPIEGEWYTTTYRQAIVGFSDSKGNKSRFIEDMQSIRNTEGSDRQTRTDKLAINYAAVTVQYFASAIAVDNEQEKRNFLEYVRATPVGPTNKGKEFLDDLTVRAITEAFSADQETTHKYLLYQGPVKVRLLRQMPKDKAVDDVLVDRYLDNLHLDTLTDAPMSNALGRFANAIFWTDLVITFTNLIHSLLWLLYQVIPNLGICILIITVIVRGMLFPLSRRQAANAQKMQAKMAKLQPELKKLQAKYGDDFQTMNQERLKLYREHGVNPFAAMGGCVLLLLQMPVFMGLYYALQESVFFRLEGFLWISNLAAPDMLVYWSESIPFISMPGDIGSTLYLGPYFNLLPVLAVYLMLHQQKAMMPQSDDPQVQAQQRMMKFMMILMGVFFYKMPAGLCLYFIASSLWGMAERKLVPKAKKPNDNDTSGSEINNGEYSAALRNKKDEKFEEPKPLGWWGRRKARWKARWKEILDQAQKQAEHRRSGQQPGSDSERERAPGKKKKKKRK